jgi:hypothetical protein
MMGGMRTQDALPYSQIGGEIRTREEEMEKLEQATD